MASGAPMGDDEPIVAINITPLVDIVLVLMIIFLVTAAQMVRHNMPITVPRAASGQSDAAPMLAVAITKNGELYVNARHGTLADIATEIQDTRTRLKPTQKLTAFVSADVATPYAKVARVIDVLRQHQVVDIALDTRPQELEDPKP